MTGLKGSSLKKKIESGQPILGAWLLIPEPTISRFMSRLGYDFLLIDWEHAAINRESLQNMIQGFEGSSTCPLVRLPMNDPLWAKWALDFGAEGVVVPNVQNSEEALRAVQACKYPPAGIRGWGPRIPSNFFADLDTYNNEANQRTVVIVQIEHYKAVANLDEILGVEGIDSIFIGPADLSASLGIACQWEHPLLIEKIREIIDRARAVGMPVSMSVDDPAPQILRWISEGVQIVTLGFDWAFMRDGAKVALESVTALMSEVKSQGSPVP
jgi:2-keto-3-deoxy-L-rhamnonate aldolase RhmA